MPQIKSPVHRSGLELKSYMMELCKTSNNARIIEAIRVELHEKVKKEIPFSALKSSLVGELMSCEWRIAQGSYGDVLATLEWIHNKLNERVSLRETFPELAKVSAKYTSLKKVG